MPKALKLWAVCSLGIFRKLLKEAIFRFEAVNPGAGGIAFGQAAVASRW